jgi:hypothetical protein
MRRRDWLVSGGVALVCATILVLFTDIELGLVHRFSCPAGAGSNGGDGAADPACR